MGCGRVGSTLARSLEERDHTVSVIDSNADSFRRLGPSFGGRKVMGVGFDREVLTEAGIDRADAFAAVSSGDNSNIIAARVARETFHVDHVVARIYDADRARLYQRLGIPTVASIQWTADQVLHRLLPAGTAAAEHRDASGRLLVTELVPHSSWWGRRLTDVESTVGMRIAYLTRLGDGQLPRPGDRLQEGDVLHAVYPVDRRDQVEAALQGEARVPDGTDEDEEGRA